MKVPVINIVTRKVRKGKEAELEQVLSEFIKESLSFSGLQGVNVIRPASDNKVQEYSILRQFASKEDRDQFYASELFLKWEKKAAECCEGIPKPRVVTGLEAWFTLPGQKPVKPPPQWKMALLTLLAVYPLTLIIPAVLPSFIMRQPKYIVNCVVSISLTALLTWLIMPNLTKLFNGWINK